MGSLALRVTLEQRARGERSGFQDPGERTVRRGRRVGLDLPVNSDRSDQWERRENLAFLDFLDILEDSDQRGRSGSQDSQDRTARREQGV